MTTRHKGYIVALKDDVRDDDAGDIITALQMVSGVLSVTAIKATPHEDSVAKDRALRDMEKMLWQALRDYAKRERG